MTSKILLPSLRRENLKHRLGIVLAVFGLFFLYMLSFAINVFTSSCEASCALSAA